MNALLSIKFNEVIPCLFEKTDVETFSALPEMVQVH